MTNPWRALADELGDRVVSDLRAENGPVGEGVVLKRLYFAEACPRSEHAGSILSLKQNDEFWSKALNAFMRFERWSKKGNAVARRSYGWTGKPEYTVLRRDIEIIWDGSTDEWGEGWD